VTRERVPAIDNGQNYGRPSYEWRRAGLSPGEVVTHPVAAPFQSLKASRSFLKTRPVRRTVPGTGLVHPLLSRRARALTFCSKSICRAQSINSVARPGG